MKFRQSLFWDTDPTKIDPQKHARYIIERIMDFGDVAEVRWMWKQYPKQLLRSVVQKSRGLHKSSKTLWEKLTQ